MKVLDSNGKLRELNYHPEVIKGKDKRLTTKINNNEYEQTDEFRKLQESRNERIDEWKLYHSDEKVLTDEDRRQLGDIFRRQLDAAGNSAGIKDGILSAGNRKGTNCITGISTHLYVQAIFNRSITRQTLPGWHCAQVTQVGHGMKVLDSNGKLRELKYHPEVIKGKDKRLTTKLITMNTNKQMSLENFKKAVEKEIMMSNYTIQVKNVLKKRMQNDLDLYLEDNLTPQETVLALLMGY